MSGHTAYQPTSYCPPKVGVQCRFEIFPIPVQYEYSWEINPYGMNKLRH